MRIKTILPVTSLGGTAQDDTIQGRGFDTLMKV